jgi:hypothetical protein
VSLFYLKPRKRSAGPLIYWFCIPRHNEAINSVFMDLSIRRVGLKELWTLKWNRTQGAPRDIDWDVAAPWMADFKDY